MKLGKKKTPAPAPRPEPTLYDRADLALAHKEAAEELAASAARSLAAASDRLATTLVEVDDEITRLSGIGRQLDVARDRVNTEAEQINNLLG